MKQYELIQRKCTHHPGTKKAFNNCQLLYFNLSESFLGSEIAVALKPHSVVKTKVTFSGVKE
jgi:hypothetical protein